MTESQSSLFDVQIDENGKRHLLEIAKWSKFFGILGYILSALLLILGLSLAFIGGGMSDAFSQVGVSGAAIGFFYILIALLYFYPSYKMLQFAKLMPAGIHQQQQESVSLAFGEMKAVFRYFGILTIIVLCLYAIGIVIAMFLAIAA